MPIIINSIFSAPGTAAEEVIEKALSLVGLNVKDTVKAAVFKSSLDARKRNDIHFVHSVYAELADSSQEEALCSRYASVNYAVECKVEPIYGTERPDGRIYVAGFGPAGMFCALLLAENGYRPIVLERGGDVDSRVAAVNKTNTGKVGSLTQTVMSSLERAEPVPFQTASLLQGSRILFADMSWNDL